MEQIRFYFDEHIPAAVAEAGKVRTRDIGGAASTNEFADAIIAKL